MRILGFSIPLIIVLALVFIVGAKYGAPIVAKIPVVGN